MRQLLKSIVSPLLMLGALSLGAAAADTAKPAHKPEAPREVKAADELVTTEVLFRHGYSEVIYDPEYIPVLGLKVGIKTLILLPSDEKIVRVEVGVRGTALEIKYGANWVGLRPNIERISTNIHIASDQGRVYSFNLIEGGGPHSEPHQKVVVLRPDMDLDAEGAPLNAPPTVQQQQAQPPQQGQAQNQQAQMQQQRDLPAVIGMDNDPPVQLQRTAEVPGVDVLRKLDQGYKIKNQKPKVFEVQKVYNDGQRTFIIFKTAMLEAPLFYRIDPNGKREIVTYHMEAAKDPRDLDVFVIPRLIDKGAVKIGDYESTFVWKKAE